MFDNLTNRLSSVVQSLKGSGRLTDKNIKDTLRQIRLALLEADVSLPVVKEFISNISEKVVGTKFDKSLTPGQALTKIIQNELIEIFGNNSFDLNLNRSAPIIIMLVGLQGSGKTTTAGKLAHYIKDSGRSPMLAACDTFRAAAIEQLNLWGSRLDIPVISSEYGADPASVAHDAVNSSLSKEVDYLLIDTAGRLHTKHNLMRELEKLHRVISTKCEGAPHETLLVVDASIGSNALTQAREFNKSVPLTGLVISKLDGTSKGGMVVAIQNELKLPVKFVGLGEKPEDLQKFEPSEYARALFFNS